MYWEYYVYIFCSSLASFETEKFQNFVGEENLAAAVVLKQKVLKCVWGKFRCSLASFETEKFQNFVWEENFVAAGVLKQKSFKMVHEKIVAAGRV